MRIIDEKTKNEIKNNVIVEPSEYVHRPKNPGDKIKWVILFMLPFFCIMLFLVAYLVRGISWHLEKKSLVEAKVGDTVTFGTAGDEDEVLTWTVLDGQGDRLLLFCNLSVGSIIVREDNGADSWEHSEQRAFLNGEFYERAFSEKEKKLLIEMKLDAETNAETAFSSGNATTDMAFLLSSEEVSKYAQHVSGNTVLRSPGEGLPLYLKSGKLSTDWMLGEQLKYRPAVWVDVSGIK